LAISNAAIALIPATLRHFDQLRHALEPDASRAAHWPHLSSLSIARIHNLYYDGTVEARIYRKLRDLINTFASVVGNLQPILAQVPTFIERALTSVDSEEEDVLLSEFEAVLDALLYDQP
jgi:hypothetical protein